MVLSSVRGRAKPNGATCGAQASGSLRASAGRRQPGGIRSGATRGDPPTTPFSWLPVVFPVTSVPPFGVGDRQRGRETESRSGILTDEGSPKGCICGTFQDPRFLREGISTLRTLRETPCPVTGSPEVPTRPTNPTPLPQTSSCLGFLVPLFLYSGSRRWKVGLRSTVKSTSVPGWGCKSTSYRTHCRVCTPT